MEHPLEEQVSKFIGAMSALCLPIDDTPGPQSLRAYIERNSIALLSNCACDAADPPSAEWLGCDSSSELVRASGLWNNRHVNETCDPAFLSKASEIIRSLPEAEALR